MKKQFLIGCTVYALAAALPGHAQVSDSTLKTRYEHEAIWLAGNKNRYHKQNDSKKIHAFGRGIRHEFDSCGTEAKDEFKRYRHHKLAGTACMVAGGAGLVLLLAGAVFVPYIAAPIFWATMAASSGAYIGGALQVTHARNHLEKAVWLHNRDVVVKN